MIWRISHGQKASYSHNSPQSLTVDKDTDPSKENKYLRLSFELHINKTTMKVLVCVVSAVMLQCALAMNVPMIQPPQNGIDKCDLCVGFADFALKKLVHAFAHGSIMGGCEAICSNLPEDFPQGSVATCTALCTIVGAKEFNEIIKNSDLDADFFCQKVKMCPERVFEQELEEQWTEFAVDKCDACIGFVDFATGPLLQILSSGAVFSGCSDLCERLPEKFANYIAPTCTFVCTVTGIEEFKQLVARVDLDNVKVCQEAKMCPFREMDDDEEEVVEDEDQPMMPGDFKFHGLKKDFPSLDFDKCDACVSFANFALGPLAKSVASGTVMYGCTELCSYMPKNTPDLLLATCDFACSFMGIEKFLNVMEEADLDTTYFCQKAKMCDVVYGGDAEFTSFTVTPDVGPQGIRTLEFAYRSQKGTVAGEIDFTIRTIDGLPVAYTIPKKATTSGRFSGVLQLHAEVNHACDVDTDVCEQWLPGRYIVDIAMCSGSCSSDAASSFVYDVASTSFVITEE